MIQPDPYSLDLMSRHARAIRDVMDRLGLSVDDPDLSLHAHTAYGTFDATLAVTFRRHGEAVAHAAFDFLNTDEASSFRLVGSAARPMHPNHPFWRYEFAPTPSSS